MDHGEYEGRRRAIQEQLDADLELVRAGAEARFRALESLRLASPEEERLGVQIETPASVEAPASPVPAATAAPVSSPGSTAGAARRGDILKAILATFPHLPDVFDKSDVVRLLGYVPSRPTLHRAWSRLIQEKRIGIARFSDGRRPMGFKKLAAEAQTDQECHL